MKKRMLIMLICVGLLFGGIFGYKMFGNMMMKRYFASNQAPVVTVSAMKAGYSNWQPLLKLTGSLRAVHGVNITTELAGMVQAIYFTPGTLVQPGTVLAQLNADSDIAQLHALEATAQLAEITLKRDQAQYKAKAISKAALDTDEANLKNAQAQATAQAATIAKKTIRAPFAGHLGISAVNLGQYVNPGDAIVTLQSLDPIYVDFYVPQQQLSRLQIDQTVTIKVDTYPGKVFTGKITTINPLVDSSTRNMEVEATIANPKYELVPGMFATVEVSTGQPQRQLTLPQTAISFNPYGNLVYIVKQNGNDGTGNPILTATQTFVNTGETRGDQIAITQGLNEGDLVVTSGQIKLKNGSQVAINNTVVPQNNPAPTPIDE